MTGTDFLLNMMATPDAALQSALDNPFAIEALAAKYGIEPDRVRFDIVQWLRRTK